MKRGKYICSQLKAIRRSIAEENIIPLYIPECTYEGECRGTCPRCEAEVRYLEKELARRTKLGLAATVAGVAMCLSACVGSGTPAPDTKDTLVELEGVVIAADSDRLHDRGQGIYPIRRRDGRKPDQYQMSARHWPRMWGCRQEGGNGHAQMEARQNEGENRQIAVHHPLLIQT